MRQEDARVASKSRRGEGIFWSREILDLRPLKTLRPTERKGERGGSKPVGFLEGLGRDL